MPLHATCYCRGVDCRCMLPCILLSIDNAQRCLKAVDSVATSCGQRQDGAEANMREGAKA